MAFSTLERTKEGRKRANSKKTKQEKHNSLQTYTLSFISYSVSKLLCMNFQKICFQNFDGENLNSIFIVFKIMLLGSRNLKSFQVAIFRIIEQGFQKLNQIAGCYF